MREIAPACPVAALLPDIQATIDALHAVERIGKADHSPCREDMDEALSRRLKTLEDLASQAVARSLPGALLQVMLASSDADALAGNADDAWKKESDRFHARVQGCLYSVRRLLEELAGAPLGEELAYFWMTPAQDPHAALAEGYRLAREDAAA